MHKRKNSKSLDDSLINLDAVLSEVYDKFMLQVIEPYLAHQEVKLIIEKFYHPQDITKLIEDITKNAIDQNTQHTNLQTINTPPTTALPNPPSRAKSLTLIQRQRASRKKNNSDPNTKKSYPSLTENSVTSDELRPNCESNIHSNSFPTISNLNKSTSNSSSEVSLTDLGMVNSKSDSIHYHAPKITQTKLKVKFPFLQTSEKETHDPLPKSSKVTPEYFD
ncbi:hypothetical protein L3V82_12265 [Thiotrichales bacterium 19S3-7]|nr:hypothetical protein [Thiotrichales bacterium 19S3-7]MCF6802964.1 hypothetical protein [Thiotrichales bacterium 19S3-11]